MTTPGGAGGGFSQGDDYVAMRLGITIPDDVPEKVREITTAVENYRTTLEAAAHAEQDVNNYLEQMTTATTAAAEAQANLTAQLQQYLSLTSRAGVATPTSGVPLGTAVNPFQNMGGQFQTGGMGSPTGERPPNPSDVASQLGTAQSNNPREWLNMQHARGGVTAQDVVNISHESIAELADKIARREQEAREALLHTKAQAPQEPQQQGTARPTTAQRISRAVGLSGQVANELESGGPHLGLRNLATRGLDWLANSRKGSGAPGRAGPPATSGSDSEVTPDTPGGGGSDAQGDTSLEEQSLGLSKIVGMIPMVGKALVGLLGVFGLVQSGGQMIQGMRNVGSLRGGAAGEGFQTEFKARMLAMSPFLTQDQARQIYQAVMSEGYADASGAGADNVVDFMSQNLQKMNISVADSVKMLRTEIIGSGKGDPASVQGAIDSLSQELGAIKTLSRESKISTPDYTKDVAGLQERMIAAGAGTEGARYGAMVAEETGAGDLTTKKLFPEASAEMMSGAKMGAMLLSFGGPGGTPLRDPEAAQLLPQAVPGYLGATGQLQGAQRNVLRYWAKQASYMDNGTDHGHRNAITMFQEYLKVVIPEHPAVTNYAQAEAFYKEMLGGELEAASGRVEDQGIKRPEGPRGGGGGAPPGSGNIPFTPEGMPSLTTPPSGGGGGGGAAPSGTGGGGGGGFAGATGSGTASVTIGLTPEAARVLQVQGPQVVQIPPDKAASNAAAPGAQKNNMTWGR